MIIGDDSVIIQYHVWLRYLYLLSPDNVGKIFEICLNTMFIPHYWCYLWLCHTTCATQLPMHESATDVQPVQLNEYDHLYVNDRNILRTQIIWISNRICNQWA